MAIRPSDSQKTTLTIGSTSSATLLRRSRPKTWTNRPSTSTWLSRKNVRRISSLDNSPNVDFFTFAELKDFVLQYQKDEGGLDQVLMGMNSNRDVS